MHPVVLDKPYVPVPPVRWGVWPWVLGGLVPWYLRRRYGVEHVECVGAEKLRASVEAGCGVMVTPNHCRDEDPLVLQALSRAVGRPFYVVASWHTFMMSRVQGVLMRRMGALSIYREGMDKTALTTSIDILASAERPLVIFPEGHIARTNDLLLPLMDGAGLIARQAAKKRAKDAPPKKVVIHPVALRYRFLGDINASAHAVLDEIEHRLTWHPSRGLGVHERIWKVGAGLLALKELEYVGRTGTGTLAERLRVLIDAILTPLEEEWCPKPTADEPYSGENTLARVKRLRTCILPDMVKGDIEPAERERRWKHLRDVYVALQLDHYPEDYVYEGCSPERILETIERFEDDLTDRVRVHGPIRATVTVGDAIEVPAGKGERGGRDEGDPLMEEVERSLRAMLGIG